ncbi:hypothetical protein B0H19DRAFT_1077974 [Mycena capillaripes]|nr:hypothetical protein B0H19DRAFT_1077974 [Mycena capillaripes]
MLGLEFTQLGKSAHVSLGVPIPVGISKPTAVGIGRQISRGGQTGGSEHMTGQTLNNITNYTTAPPTVPSDFRRVPLGNIDLQHKICLDHATGLVDRRVRPSARRIQTLFRFVLLQLPGEYILPSSMMVFLKEYQHSHFSTVYIYAYVVGASIPYHLRDTDIFKGEEFQISVTTAAAVVNLRTVLFCASNKLEESFGIAFLPKVEVCSRITHGNSGLGMPLCLQLKRQRCEQKPHTSAGEVLEEVQTGLSTLSSVVPLQTVQLHLRTCIQVVSALDKRANPFRTHNDVMTENEPWEL